MSDVVRRALLRRLMRDCGMPRRQWRAVVLRDPCVYCYGKAKAVDHIHPENAGGPDGWENKAPACHGCNLMKADGSLMWMLWRLHEKRSGRYRRRIIGHRLAGGTRVPIRSMLEYQGVLRKPASVGAVDPVGEKVTG